MKISSDKIIFDPDNVDLKFSPIRKDISEETFVLGAFNPGMERLPNGNLLIMVRIAEALRNPIVKNSYKIIRWIKNTGYKIDLKTSVEISLKTTMSYKQPECIGLAHNYLQKNKSELFMKYKFNSNKS